MVTCGLLTSSNKPVPLRRVAVDACIQSFVADVSSELLYKNEESDPVEAIFTFPMDADSAVYAFQARIQDTIIKAQIQDKKEAQEIYEDALASGQSSFLLEQMSGGDVFSCSLGNLPPGEEAVLSLRYVQELPLEADGATRFVLPAVLHPRYAPQGWEEENVTAGVSYVAKGELPYTLSLSVSLQSPHGIARVHSNCSLTPLNYTAQDQTAAQVSLAQSAPHDRDVELLVYYARAHKPSAMLEPRMPSAQAGTLMGDPVAMVTLLPNIPEAALGQSQAGEFIFLLDRSGSMGCPMDSSTGHPLRIDSAKDTLVLLLKSLPLGCYFNIYSFGSNFESFYPQSVEYTQRTMADSLKRVQSFQADLGGTEILRPLQAIYGSPCRDGHPRQIFVFTDGEVGNTQEVIAEVQRHHRSHRCFSFGIGQGASTALIKGIAKAGGGVAEFITGQDRMAAKVLRSLKWALQPAVTGISLSWELPPGMEAVPLRPDPKVIFQGQRLLVYSQLRGQPQAPESSVGSVTLQYTIKDETFKDTVQFPLQPQEGDRLPIHRLAAKALLQELEPGLPSGSEESRHRALEASLSSGVVCSLTAYVGVDTRQGRPVQGPLRRCPIPLAGFPPIPRVMKDYSSIDSCTYKAVKLDHHRRYWSPPHCSALEKMTMKLARCEMQTMPQAVAQEGASPLIKLVSLQNANGSWGLDSALASALGVSETDVKGKMPSEGVEPGVWATVLAVVWLHSRSAAQREEWELLEIKAVGWLRSRAGSISQLDKCLEAANALLGCSVAAPVFGL
ncbi:von Willebrand factor A domain-containing protein 5A-like isoform X1 [Alligator mississippiensis]|uniref:von Willebrand factor A domain-containing protein 5A-like isoform X1 n=1 Tax=Alligator mississippiensis TaxID=8496 RepID=UPI002877406A|nr:von Willebrand factor A domain-containing protein 5A-like isoform X1 [Alligator mississippiensis]